MSDPLRRAGVLPQPVRPTPLYASKYSAVQHFSARLRELKTTGGSRALVRGGVW